MHIRHHMHRHQMTIIQSHASHKTRIMWDQRKNGSGQAERRSCSLGRNVLLTQLNSFAFLENASPSMSTITRHKHANCASTNACVGSPSFESTPSHQGPTHNPPMPHLCPTHAPPMRCPMRHHGIRIQEPWKSWAYPMRHHHHAEYELEERHGGERQANLVLPSRKDPGRTPSQTHQHTARVSPRHR
jgi:hypothetical protein